jgi:sporulation protein YlmC with PRC-barrel domain
MIDTVEVRPTRAQEVAIMTVEKTPNHRNDAKEIPTFSKLRDVGQTVANAVDDIRGRMVKDKNGQKIGRIDGLMIDDVERKVRFIEVASGGFLGFGESRSFIPVEAITRIADDEVYISHTREHVAGAPPYDPDLVVAHSDYFFGLYPYYGYSGYLGFVPATVGYPYASNEPTPSKASGG